MFGCYLAIPEVYDQQERLESKLTLKELLTKGHPDGRCTGPLLLRNAFQTSPEEAQLCQDNSEACFRLVTERLESILGSHNDGTLFAYPMEHLAAPKRHGVRHTKGEHMSLHDYLQEPQYDNYVVHALHQVGNASHYQQLLEIPSLPDTYRSLTRFAWHKYMGSQLFLNRANHTGSHMHYEFGSNVFVVLAGSKRWVDVHPDYLYKANCSVGHNGFYGHCFPNEYTGEKIAGRVSLDEYEQALLEAGVPREGFVSFVMNAGDVLLNCDLWGHAIENLSPAVGFSLRYMANPVLKMKWRFSTLMLLKDSLWASVKEMINNPGSMTMIGSIICPQGKMDKDERMKDLGVLNQRKLSHFKG